MDLNRIPNSRNLARLRYEETRKEAQSDSQDRVRGAREALIRLSEIRAQRIRQGRGRAQDSHIELTRETSRQQSDRIEISSRARILAGNHDVSASSSDEEARAQKLAEVKARLESGGLHTPEALERAASRLLSSGDL